jgi:peptidoglycan/LPS O-acetylase OafA/YrhL
MRPPAWLLLLSFPLLVAGSLCYRDNSYNVLWSLLFDYGIAFGGVWLVGRAAVGLEGVVEWLLSFAPLVYIGSISYGIYIWHDFMPWALAHWGSRLHFHSARSLATWLISTLLMSLASSMLFDRPVNRLKRFFPYTRPARKNGLPTADAHAIGAAGS